MRTARYRASSPKVIHSRGVAFHNKMSVDCSKAGRNSTMDIRLVNCPDCLKLIKLRKPQLLDGTLSATWLLKQRDQVAGVDPLVSNNGQLPLLDATSKKR